MVKSFALRIVACLSVALLVLQLGQAEEGEEGTEVRRVDFNRDVRPLLSARCFHCHGPDQKERKARLRLDVADGPDGAYRVRGGTPAISPGSPEESELWARITTADADDAMPPAESHKAPLSEDERDLIRRWIEQGAEYEDHWSFVPLETPAVPSEVDDWAVRPLDRFVSRRLKEEGLQPSPRADARTLIRRLSLDLTGLPPTREEIRAFLSDDSPEAYERLVDRLLAKPQYGEHMAKYWLDLVRFADTNGVHHDHYREMSPYRDWVIRALNANLSYDEFATYQIAGDLFEDPTKDQLVASGFNRLHLIIDVGTALPEESRARNVIDRVTAFGTVFLGLTVQCAVCHDHKYDPLTQRDFFQLSAFFNNLDAKPETGSGDSDKNRGIQPPYIDLPTSEQRPQLDELDGSITLQEATLASLRISLDGASSDEERRTIENQIAHANEELGRLTQLRARFIRAVPAAMVMRERAEIRPAHILVRGAYDNPGEEVPRDAPAFLPPMAPLEEGATRSRMDLARWLASPDHPLTARVAVNRIWQQLFGVGLAKTSEDLGAQGEWPSHVDLLDHLAASFVASGWDVKALVKEIVSSATYQQSSSASRADFERDPENRLLARGARFRLDSEVIRDQILATSGLLNPELYGKSVKPPQPKGVWEAVTLPGSFPRIYEADSGDKIYRRSLYTFWKRGMPPPQMTILNAPSRESCTARRERTSTALQALLLMNESEYLKAARHLARTTVAEGPTAPAGRLDVLYETITTRLPDAGERDALLRLVRDLRATYATEPALADELCEGLELEEGESAPEIAAWTMLVSTIYNLDATKTRE